ncbi:hypothetical protein P154DRAFT_492065 [Amniculicola lignicola CBS 123094]|uniref:BTB domain-containing protein n=1 Tax=Amniculicola lignicola CBS 123094 TaxID=1392246 RepID=A0A6A5WS79_9PLEO|nr:hypothetical protein P154DRAFT_492065 [Amniculicola lignicola CBS 123094]
MATQNSDIPSTSVVEIATNGDVILVVGPEEKRLQVCSSVLKNASKYFKNMFGPHFSEGQDLTTSSPKEIPMPEDDANVLEIICNIIHLRNDDVPEAVSPTKALGLAVAADKFECVVAVKHASTLWLKPREVQDITELGRLVAAAYILDSTRAFSDITLCMVLHHKDSYLSLAGEDLGLDESVVWHVIYLLEERRSQMHVALQHMLLDGSTDAGSDYEPQCTCGWSGQHCLAYIGLLRTNNLWPSNMADITISQVMEKINVMGDPTLGNGWAQCGYRWHRTTEYGRMRKYRLDSMQRSNGVCIDCVRSRATATKRNCRIKHNSK